MVWTLIYNAKLSNQIARIVAIVVKSEVEQGVVKWCSAVDYREVECSVVEQSMKCTELDQRV